MIIENVLKYTEDKTFVFSNIGIENERFVEDGASRDVVIDGEGCYAIPGLIDIHFHGCVGHDFCDGTNQSIKSIAAYQASVGVTTIVPATMTLPQTELHRIMKATSEYKNQKGCAALAGINMEGPYINPEKKGAQSLEHIRSCDVAEFRRLQQAASGMIKLVDIAPEMSGAMEFIDALHNEVNISIAHSNADYDTAKQAFERGANHVTHLFNAMPPFSHREPSIVGAAHDSDCYVELICDGVHIHPSAVRTAFDMFSDRIVLVSDSMRATGMPDGTYTLGGQTVNVKGKYARLESDGSLAGSVTNLSDCLRIAVNEMGIPLEKAVAAATMNPAKSVGIYETYGSITAGKAANVVLLDKQLNLKDVIVGGYSLKTI